MKYLVEKVWQEEETEETLVETVEVEADNFVIDGGAIKLFNVSNGNVVAVAAFALGYWASVTQRTDCVAD